MCHLLIDLFIVYECWDMELQEYRNMAFLQAVWCCYAQIHHGDINEDDPKPTLCSYHEHNTEEEEWKACEGTEMRQESEHED